MEIHRELKALLGERAELLAAQPVSMQAIADAEERLDFDIPSDYRELLEFSDGLLLRQGERRCFLVYPIRDATRRTLSYREVATEFEDPETYSSQEIAEAAPVVRTIRRCLCYRPAHPVDTIWCDDFALYVPEANTAPFVTTLHHEDWESYIDEQEALNRTQLGLYDELRGCAKAIGQGERHGPKLGA